ncbi:MAG: DUF1428 domain-containing protein [Aridibacter famidurans]|nr:DUF1428 domain-containing protein [Aridibacter famidurans]
MKGMKWMGKYVDGFVIPVRKDAVDEYRRLAETVSRKHIEEGALEYVECVGDDLASEHTASFKDMAGIAEDETVVFTYIVYPSKEDRDRVNACLMDDEEVTVMMENATHVFDPKRMAFGGFRAIVEAYTE